MNDLATVLRYVIIFKHLHFCNRVKLMLMIRLLNKQTLKKEAILEACISDYCYCKDDNRKACACNGLAVFAKECHFQGISLKPDWRNMEICRKWS